MASVSSSERDASEVGESGAGMGDAPRIRTRHLRRQQGMEKRRELLRQAGGDADDDQISPYGQHLFYKEGDHEGSSGDEAPGVMRNGPQPCIPYRPLNSGQRLFPVFEPSDESSSVGERVVRGKVVG